MLNVIEKLKKVKDFLKPSGRRHPFMRPDQLTKLEDRRTEYVALRTEIIHADNACLLMMGYLIASVGALYTASLEWLVSLLSFISLCYFMEKRFMIRNLACFIADEICKDDSGFQWEKYVQQLRQESKLRSHFRLRPYNVEIIVCSVIALSPVVKGVDFANKPSSFFWLIFTIITLILSAVNWREYNRSLKIRK